MFAFNVKSDAVQKVIANITQDVVNLLNSTDRQDNSIIPLINIIRGLQDITEEASKACQTIMSGKFPEIRSVIAIPGKPEPENKTEQNESTKTAEQNNDNPDSAAIPASTAKYCNMLHKPYPDVVAAPSGGAEQLKLLEDPEKLAALIKTFGAIKCDIRNVEVDVNNLQNIQTGTTPTGLDYIAFTVGGDWECPVQVFLYWNGDEFRAYVPIKGNRINTLIKAAFGNNDEKDLEYLRTEFNQSIQEDRLYEFCSLLEINFNACLEDFTTTVKIDNSLNRQEEECHDSCDDTNNTFSEDENGVLIHREEFRTAPKGGKQELCKVFAKYQRDPCAKEFNENDFYILDAIEDLETLQKDIGAWKVMALDDTVADKECWGTTSTGLDYFAVAIGGDEEHPVQTFFYWDGTQARGYLPLKGNYLNPKTGKAYCMDDEEWEELDPAGIDFGACLKDFEEHIKVA